MKNESSKVLSQQYIFSLLFALTGFIITLILKLNNLNLVFAFVFFGSSLSVIYSGKAVFILGFDFIRESYRVLSGFWATVIALTYLIIGISLLR